MNLHWQQTLKNYINKYWVILVTSAAFLAVHLYFFSFNTAEWGDSYRILRASEAVRKGYYPSDEKRPPLTAFLIATQPSNIDQVVYARLLLMIFSFGAYLLFYSLLKIFIEDKFWQTWAMLAFLLNNVYLYWSIRVMADVPFSFFVLCCFYLFTVWRQTRKNNHLLLMGLVCGLAILTRFEGYLLGLSIFLGILFVDKKVEIFKSIRYLSIFGVSSLFTVAPYLLFRNPLTSSYFEEPTSRTYDINMLAVYLASFLSLTGISFLLYFPIAHLTATKKIFSLNLPMLIFFILDMLLVLSWPAAVPRLFVPIIPIVILVIARGLEISFENSTSKLIRIREFMLFGVLLGIYVISQYFLKLQFLILDRNIFVLNILLQIILITYAVFKKKINFVILSLLIMLIWSYSIISLHRNIFISVKSAAQYAGQNLSGNIAYNDISSVSDWYINYRYTKPGLRGFYYNTEKKSNLSIEALHQAKINYLLITNEHNTTMTLDLNKRSYLKELVKFEYDVNGKKFVSRVVEVL